MDETYVLVAGAWTYLYSAVDSGGETIDFMLSPNRDLIDCCLQIKQESARDGVPFVSSGDTHEGAQPRALQLVGSDLTPSDYAALEARWIDRPLAGHAGIRRVDSLTGGEIIGRKSGNYAGIVIPYFRPGSHQVRDYRLRRDQPDIEYDSAGNLKARQRYLSPPARSNMLYLVSGTDERLLQDAAVPVLIN